MERVDPLNRGNDLPDVREPCAIKSDGCDGIGGSVVQPIDFSLDEFVEGNQRVPLAQRDENFGSSCGRVGVLALERRHFTDVRRREDKRNIRSASELEQLDSDCVRSGPSAWVGQARVVTAVQVDCNQVAFHVRAVYRLSTRLDETEGRINCAPGR